MQRAGRSQTGAAVDTQSLFFLVGGGISHNRHDPVMVPIEKYLKGVGELL